MPSRPNRPRPGQRPRAGLRSRPPVAEPVHCVHFGTCGGCSSLDQPIAWQLHEKAAECEALLAPFLDGQRVAFDEPETTPRHFRTRLLYPVRPDRDGQPIAGLYEFRSHAIVRIEECKTMDRWLVGFGQAAEAALRDLRLAPFDPRRKRGKVKALWARLASGTGQVLAGVVTSPGEFAKGKALADAFYQAARAQPEGRKPRQLVGVVHSISEREDEFLLADRHMPLRGSDHITDRRDDLTFRISAGSFYQIHADAHRLLYAPALRLVGKVRGQHVVDGFGGVGTFGLRLAKAGAARVTIVEDNAAACRDAEHNAKANDLAGVEVVKSPFGSWHLPPGVDLLVVDPPRSGLGSKAIQRVLAAPPARILYVACAADSLARDLGELHASGYRVRAIRLCDMFPHTEHVELVALLERGA